MIRFTCRACGATLKAPEGTEARKSRCRCGQAVTVPQASFIPVATLLPSPAIPAAPFVRGAAAIRHPSKSWKLVALAGAIFAVVGALAVGVGVFLGASPLRTEMGAGEYLGKAIGAIMALSGLLLFAAGRMGAWLSEN